MGSCQNQDSLDFRIYRIGGFGLSEPGVGGEIAIRQKRTRNDRLRKAGMRGGDVGISIRWI